MRPIHFVVETGSQAGGVRVIGEYCNGLARMGFPVSIWSVKPKETMAWFDLDKRVKWYSFLKTGTTEDYGPLVETLQKQEGFKIATFWRTAYAVDEAAQPGEGLYLVQDIETSYTSPPIMAQGVMETYGLPLRKFTTSRWVEAQLPGTIHTGIGIPSFYSPAKQQKRNHYPLACLRRQTLKGWSTMIELAGYMHRKGRRLHTFGHDYEVKIMYPINHNPGLQRKQGTLPDDKYIRSLYREYGAFVSTSRHEGFNMTALEAMACGIPVVKTRDHGSDEYMEPDENCLWADDAEGLCAQVMRVLADTKLHNHLVRNGLKTAAKYTWGEAVQKLALLLTE